MGCYLLPSVLEEFEGILLSQRQEKADKAITNEGSRTRINPMVITQCNLKNFFFKF